MFKTASTNSKELPSDTSLETMLEIVKPHILFLKTKLLNTRVVYSACKHMDLQQACLHITHAKPRILHLNNNFKKTQQHHTYSTHTQILQHTSESKEISARPLGTTLTEIGCTKGQRSFIVHIVHTRHHSTGLCIGTVRIIL